MRDGVIDRALRAVEVRVVRCPARRLGERVELALLRPPRLRARRREVLTDVVGGRGERHLGHARRRHRDRPSMRPHQLLRQVLRPIHGQRAAPSVHELCTIARVGVDVVGRARRERGVVLQLRDSISLAPVPPRSAIRHVRRLVLDGVRGRPRER